MITLNKVNPEDFPAVDNLFQSAFWGKFKAACGQQAVFFLCEYENSVHEKLDFPLLVLLRKSPGGIYAYAPKAPSVKVSESEYGIVLEQLALSVKPFLPEETVCIRFDTQWKSLYTNQTLSETPRV